jgi:hypothetical protein
MKNHPDSNLALPYDPKPKFVGWMSDPNDPRNNGSLITLLTGGKVNLVHQRKQWEAKRATMNNTVVTAQGRLEQPVQVQPSHRERRKTKWAMKSGVLYLIFVNMPTEEEMAVAKATVH